MDQAISVERIQYGELWSNSIREYSLFLKWSGIYFYNIWIEYMRLLQNISLEVN